MPGSDCATQETGSFRDPSGHVFRSEGRIFRTITHRAAAQYAASRETLRKLADSGKLVAFEELDPATIGLASDAVAFLLEHPKIDTWTMPYEWSFALLQAAALFHLDLQIDLLEGGFVLSDSSAYNVQFVGPKPIFIDHLSVRPYVDGEFWLGHKQFSEQFLNPLLLRAYLDIAPNAWYRGNLEGIPTADLAKLLPHRRKLSWKTLSNVILPAYFQKGATSEQAARKDLKRRRFPKVAYQSMLRQMRKWIGGLRPANVSATTWANYATTTTYNEDEQARKKAFVGDFIRLTGAKSVVDLGCNTGDYSKICLESGADRVIGFDFDQQSLDRAHLRAKAENLDFLALFLDARNPSPCQGWLQRERLGFAERIHADGVIALAFEHHLAIAHNVSLPDVVLWIMGVAPHGVIEFVPKSDPTIQTMLTLREDIFDDYTEANFEAAILQCGRIERKEVVSASGRIMFQVNSRS